MCVCVRESVCSCVCGFECVQLLGKLLLMSDKCAQATAVRSTCAHIPLPSQSASSAPLPSSYTTIPCSVSPSNVSVEQKVCCAKDDTVRHIEWGSLLMTLQYFSADQQLPRLITVKS